MHCSMQPTWRKPKKKTRTVLNRLWLEPRAELVDYADRGVAIHKDAADIPVAALCWGMAVATYPFSARWPSWWGACPPSRATAHPPSPSAHE